MKVLVWAGLIAAALGGILAARAGDYRLFAEAAGVVLGLYSVLVFKYGHGCDDRFIGIPEPAPSRLGTRLGVDDRA